VSQAAHAETFLAQAFPQRLLGHIKADLVPVFKTVCHCLGHIENLNSLTIDYYQFDTFE
jgi:hypothetical protein